MRALRRFTVRASLPEPLAALGTLATNLRWTWHQPTQDLFASVDPGLWAESGDPLRLLSVVAPDRLEALSRDEQFLAHARALADDLHRYTTGPPGWRAWPSPTHASSWA